MTYDGSFLRLYTNGVNFSSSPAALGTFIPNSSFQVGCDTNFLTMFQNGILDEVRIYNRALSATEITNLYNFRQTSLSTNGSTGYKP
jgi:hypothetical protein